MNRHELETVPVDVSRASSSQGVYHTSQDQHMTVGRGRQHDAFIAAFFATASLLISAANGKARPWSHLLLKRFKIPMHSEGRLEGPAFAVDGSCSSSGFSMHIWLFDRFAVCLFEKIHSWCTGSNEHIFAGHAVAGDWSGKCELRAADGGRLHARQRLGDGRAAAGRICGVLPEWRQLRKRSADAGQCLLDPRDLCRQAGIRPATIVSYVSVELPLQFVAASSWMARFHSARSTLVSKLICTGECIVARMAVISAIWVAHDFEVKFFSSLSL